MERDRGKISESPQAAYKHIYHIKVKRENEPIAKPLISLIIRDARPPGPHSSPRSASGDQPRGKAPARRAAHARTCGACMTMPTATATKQPTTVSSSRASVIAPGEAAMLACA